jgi:hypothetical protein
MSRRRAVSSFVVLFLSTSSLLVSAQGVVKRTRAQSLDSRNTAVSGAPKAVTQAEPALELKLTRKYTFSPGYVQSLIKISPHADNRLLRVTLDSANYYRSSDVELEGAGAARSHFFNWTQLPAGHYDIVVTIFGPDGVRGQSRDVIDVLGLR